MSNEKATKTSVIIGIPVADGRLCAHFGHCERFALFELDEANGTIVSSRELDPPAHQPGVLPRWLHEQGVTTVIAGGMGQRAQNIFAQHGIEVIVGIPSERPEGIVRDYLGGQLRPGQNICDH